MLMKNIQFILLTLLSITSCDFPEHYFADAPACVSDTTTNLKPEKQKALVAQLQNQQPSDYRYFFQTFVEEGNNTYMITNFRNKTACFDIKILVDKWDKLEGMKRTNGVSYPKELYDLKWEIQSINGQSIIRYLEMHDIID